MQWKPWDENRTEIVAKSQWIILNNFTNLEPRAGVYIFANIDHQVKYIGKAGPGRMVDEIESAIRRNKDYGATKVKALYTNSDSKALKLERDLIEKYNPPNNYV